MTNASVLFAPSSFTEVKDSWTTWQKYPNPHNRFSNVREMGRLFSDTYAIEDLLFANKTA